MAGGPHRRPRALGLVLGKVRRSQGLTVGGSERVHGGTRGLIPCQEGARPCRSRLLPRSRDPGQLPPRPAEAWRWTARGVRATLLSCMARAQRACPAHSGTGHHGITGTEHKPAPAQTASPGPGKGRWGWRAFLALAAGGQLQMGVSKGPRWAPRVMLIQPDNPPAHGAPTCAPHRPTGTLLGPRPPWGGQSPGGGDDQGLSLGDPPARW